MNMKRSVLYGFTVMATWMALTGQPALAQGIAPAEASPPPARLGVPPAGQPSQPQPLDSLAGLSADYRVGPNDLIDIDVFGVPELKRTVRVNSSGLVSLPLVGNVSLLGLTGQQAEERIASAYAEKYLQNPQVSVFIKEFTTRRITIEGAVAKPGIYPVTGQLTLLRALALAGGGGNYANLSEIMLFRKGQDGQSEPTKTYDLEAIREGKEADPVIVADDVIVVKRSAARAALRDSLFRDIVDSINPFSGLSPR
jgi:polysaccharide export outer membrane protein